MASAADLKKILTEQFADEIAERVIARLDTTALTGDVLTPKQVAAKLKVPTTTLASWRFRKVGPPSHLAGSLPRYFAKDVDAYLRQDKPGRKTSPRVGRKRGTR